MLVPPATCRSARIQSATLPLLACLLTALPAPALGDPPTPSGGSGAGDESAVPGDWLAAVSAQIQRDEYEFSPIGQEFWSAPNRAQGLRSRVSRNGIEMFPRTTDASGEGAVWMVHLETTGFGRVGNVQSLECQAVEARGNRIELEQGELVEWFVNDERGIEQGWTIAERPAGTGPLVIGLTLGGGYSATVHADGHAAVFLDAAGAQRSSYGQLFAWDADGQALDAWMRPTAHGLEVHVDEALATYPVTVDPLMTAESWTAESNQTLATLGTSVSGAGDVNGDGFSDVIITAPSFDISPGIQGRLYAYHGTASGLGLAAAWSADAPSGGSSGQSVSTAGDVNGDGYDDVIIGYDLYSNNENGEGRAFVYHGSSSGLGATVAWAVESDQVLARFGSSVSAAGDVNGDGYDDVIVGAMAYDNGEFNEGRAYVYLGSIAGLGVVESWTAESDQIGAGFGVSVSTAGDVNGDGFEDVIVGASSFNNGQGNEGRAYVYLGSTTGLGVVESWTAESNQASAQFGSSVSTAGDINGDGYSDVIIGARQYTNGQANEGRAYAYHGGAPGLSTTPAWTAESGNASALFGHSVSTAGDVDGNGYSDVIVGAFRYSNGETVEGRAYVYGGSASGLSSVEIWGVESNQVDANYGLSVSGAGDVNGDGYDDVIVGAPRYDNGEMDEGRAFVYHGASTGLNASESWTAESDQASAFFGWAVSSAGDVNLDGYDDVIVGAYLFDNGEVDEGRAYVFHGSGTGPGLTPAWTAESDQAGAQFGYAVAGAGDIDNDGYADVVIGANLYSGGEADEGRAYAFHGSATGLDATAAWTAESNQASADFGVAISGAGDVNGDGFDDVIVAARKFDNGETDEGRTFVYHGSLTGLDPVAAWTAEADQASAQFGQSVSSAGDVNGDGFDDVLVGARLFDNGQADEGRAYVYHGSLAGLAPTESWSAESNQAGAQYGLSVSDAGDVNGDGFGDVIIGARRYDNGHTNEGRAYVYHGGMTGLGLTEAWSAEGNQTTAQFATSVSSAGDVNLDGYSDVIIGADLFDNGQSNEGRAFVFYGAQAGLELTASWTAESNQNDALFGTSVSSAGDVNGDGFDDVIVGAYAFDNGQSAEGRAFVFLSDAPYEPTNYCTAGASANGCTAVLSTSGQASATSTAGFALTASGVEGVKDGLYFFGTSGRQANSWGSGTSFQCVIPPVKRLGLLTGVGTIGMCNGTFVQDLNALWCPTCPKPAKNPGVGTLVQAQLWYRDPFNTSNQTTSLSDAIEFLVTP